MKAIVVFITAFLFLFGITIFIPTLPPGEIIYAFLGISEIPFSITGISGFVLVNGIINGFVWGIIIVIIYGLCRYPSKKKVIFPVWLPKYTHSTSSAPKSKPLEPYVQRGLPEVRKTIRQVPLDQNIETIEGIGPIYGKRLRMSGVKIIDDLLRVGATRNGRYYLAKKVDVGPSTILRWVYRADFFRIIGIGKQYSSLLESAGVNSVTDLLRRNPYSLYEKLRETNRKKNLVRRTPPQNMVKGWINKAKKLGQIVIT